MANGTIRSSQGGRDVIYQQCLKIKYAPVVAMLTVLFLAAGGLLVYAFLRVRALQRKTLEGEMKEKTVRLEKELREKEKELVEHSVFDSFAEIRKDLAEGSGPSTPEEEKHNEKLLRELHEAEDEIDKKIKQMS